MHSRPRQRVVRGKIVVQDVPEVLQRGGYDARAAGGANDVEVWGWGGEGFDDGGGQ